MYLIDNAADNTFVIFISSLFNKKSVQQFRQVLVQLKMKM